MQDENTLREAVARMLRKAGFTVIETGDGAVAIGLLAAAGSKIDAVVLDVTIPGASSRAVAAAAVQARQDIKLVLTSAHGEETVRAAGFGAQAYDFIRKPFAIATLIETLRNVLRP